MFSVIRPDAEDDERYEKFAGLEASNLNDPTIEHIQRIIKRFLEEEKYRALVPLSNKIGSYMQYLRLNHESSFLNCNVLDIFYNQMKETFANSFNVKESIDLETICEIVSDFDYKVDLLSETILIFQSFYKSKVVSTTKVPDMEDFRALPIKFIINSISIRERFDISTAVKDIFFKKLDTHDNLLILLTRLVKRIYALEKEHLYTSSNGLSSLFDDVITIFEIKIKDISKLDCLPNHYRNINDILYSILSFCQSFNTTLQNRIRKIIKSTLLCDKRNIFRLIKGTRLNSAELQRFLSVFFTFSSSTVDDLKSDFVNIMFTSPKSSDIAELIKETSLIDSYEKDSVNDNMTWINVVTGDLKNCLREKFKADMDESSIRDYHSNLFTYVWTRYKFLLAIHRNKQNSHLNRRERSEIIYENNQLSFFIAQYTPHISEFIWKYWMPRIMKHILQSPQNYITFFVSELNFERSLYRMLPAMERRKILDINSKIQEDISEIEYLKEGYQFSKILMPCFQDFTPQESTEPVWINDICRETWEETLKMTSKTLLYKNAVHIIVLQTPIKLSNNEYLRISINMCGATIIDVFNERDNVNIQQLMSLLNIKDNQKQMFLYNIRKLLSVKLLLLDKSTGLITFNYHFTSPDIFRNTLTL